MSEHGPHDNAAATNAASTPERGADPAAEVRSTAHRATRRSLLTAIAAGTGAATFFGPWKTNHVWAQAAQKKPLVIGLTMDASG